MFSVLCCSLSFFAVFSRTHFPGISPIKLHSIIVLKQDHHLDYTQPKEKLRQVDEKEKTKKQSLPKNFELIFNVEPRKLEENIKLKEERNSKDLDSLISLIKEKLQKYIRHKKR